MLLYEYNNDDKNDNKNDNDNDNHNNNNSNDNHKRYSKRIFKPIWVCSRNIPGVIKQWSANSPVHTLNYAIS